MKATVLFSLLAVFLLVIGVFSCKTSSRLSEPSKEEITLQDASHSWYYFSDGDYRKVSSPEIAPVVPDKPWTEAIRISSSSCGLKSDAGIAKGYAVVNRNGILVFEDKNISFYQDIDLFNGRTAGNLVFYMGSPVFSIYRSTFFNDMERSFPSSIHPFLVQFDGIQNVSYPIINVDNLGLGENTEITDYIWDGKVWILSCKTTGEDKIQFSYLTVQPKSPLTSITPKEASDALFITDLDMTSFRTAQKPETFNEAPERLKNLLGTLANSDFAVSCYTAGGHSPRNYINAQNTEANSYYTAQAILSDSWSCALFEDGTIFLNGALDGKELLNKGKTLAMRLPEIPDGFIFSGFTISGTNLYASWEESSFYKTGRSGFLQLDLDQILYKENL